MKPTFLHPLPLWSGILLLTFANAPAQPAAPAPAPSKPPVHKPEQSALNRPKADARAKMELEEALEIAREAARSHEAGNKQMKRMDDAKDLKDNPDKAIDAIKDKLDPAAVKDLKGIEDKLKNLSKSDDGKKIIEDLKKKGAEAIKPKSSPAAPAGKFVPSTFDSVPAPQAAKAAPAELKPRKRSSVVWGEKMFFPPSADPENPDRPIPPSDPRSRTYVLIENAQVKTAAFTLSADRIDCTKSQGGGDGILPGGSPAKPREKEKSIDPVQAGAGLAPGEKAEEEPFDWLKATGRVNFVKIDNGETLTGKGGSFIYAKKSGRAVLTDWPQVQKGKTLWIATRKDATITIVPKGQPTSEGCRIEILEDDKVVPPVAPKPPAAPPKASKVP